MLHFGRYVLCDIRCHLALLTMLHALVISKLDYCNSVLVEAPEVLLRRLQSVLNAAAKLVFSATEQESPNTHLHYSVNFIGSEYRNGSVSDYACLVFMVTHRTTSLRPSTQFPAALRTIISGLPTRQLSLSHRLVASHLATAHSRWLQQEPGTPYHLQSRVLLR